MKRLLVLAAFAVSCAHAPPPVPNSYPVPAPASADSDYALVVLCVGQTDGAPETKLKDIHWREVNADGFMYGGELLVGVTDLITKTITIDSAHWDDRIVIQHELAHAAFHIPRRSLGERLGIRPPRDAHPFDPFVRCGWYPEWAWIRDHLKP